MDRAIRRTDGWRGYGWALLVSAVGTAGGWLLYHGFAPPDAGRQPRLANTNVLMLYLLGVLWVATRYGRGPSLVASIFGVAAFDFCFVPPYLRFAVEDKQYVITFAVMLLTAITISTLTHRVRQHARSAKDAWERAETEFLRNTLLSGVSHDLRTPLAAITGAASSLLETGEKLPSAARADMLALIVEEAERMERLVNNLLEITRLESGGLVLKRGPLHLQDVVGASIRRLERRLGGRSVRVAIPDDLPLVDADDVAMEQVMMNLLDNALEYAPPGQPIDIAAARSGDTVELVVADRGPGLPPGLEARIFEKFFRASAVPGRPHRGVGLGLAICKGIVQAHGGTIRAENRQGGGAVFRLTVPEARQG